ncbi:tetratricopeptide repeat protein [Flavobacteriales bacterium]|nr:tetratricopeptide repeat protein [Flavobacteriales bacterium]
MKKTWILVASVLMATTTVWGQSDLELAEFYYNEGSYEQSKLYLDQIWKKNKTKMVFDMYYDVLIALDDFEAAEKLVKSRMRGKNTRANAYVELGQLYLHFGREAQARLAFDEAMERLQPSRNSAIGLANAFLKLNELDLALEVYTKAQAMGVDNLDYQLVDLEGRRGNYDGMIDAALRLLRTKPTYFRNIQNSFIRNLRVLDNPELGVLLKGKLITAARNYPDDVAYPELLVWYFNQVRDFGNAFVHAKSLDLRGSEDGNRIVELAQTASRNKDYDTAARCYAYVAGKGRDNPYFFTARAQSLRMRMEPLLEAIPSDTKAIAELTIEYEQTLNDLGLTEETAGIAKDLAHVQAFYLQSPTQAIELLESVLEIPGIYNRMAALCKLELGDILVFQDNIWDASLLFSQVELDFKDDFFGHEAKFRNARISYYAGDFDWAQAQLDALKASTSKLISNDAIDLSLLITDNYAMDTISEPMWLYAQADLLAEQHRYDQARSKLDSILAIWPGHALEDEILMTQGRMALEQGDVDTALVLFQEVVDLHFDDILADDALFELGKLHEDVLADEMAAADYYEQLLFDYPNSLHAVEARRRFRAMRGDDIE